FAIPIRLPNGNPLQDATAVACGDDHNMALKSDGTVWVWGDNSYGQLGTGYGDWWNPVPAQVPRLPKIVAVTGGSEHSLALGADGSVWAWGLNDQGCVGNVPLNSAQPLALRLVGLDHAIGIAAGDYHSMAVKLD